MIHVSIIDNLSHIYAKKYVSYLHPLKRSNCFGISKPGHKILYWVMNYWVLCPSCHLHSQSSMYGGMNLGWLGMCCPCSVREVGGIWSHDQVSDSFVVLFPSCQFPFTFSVLWFSLDWLFSPSRRSIHINTLIDSVYQVLQIHECQHMRLYWHPDYWSGD